MWQASHDGSWPDDADGPEIWRADARACIEAVLLHPSEEAEAAAAQAIVNEMIRQTGTEPVRDVAFSAMATKVARAALIAAGMSILGRTE